MSRNQVKLNPCPVCKGAVHLHVSNGDCVKEVRCSNMSTMYDCGIKFSHKNFKKVCFADNDARAEVSHIWNNMTTS